MTDPYKVNYQTVIMECKTCDTISRVLIEDVQLHLEQCHPEHVVLIHS